MRFYREHTPEEAIKILHGNGKYTIKSESEEGIYYLVNGWNKSKAFWKKANEIKASELFSRPQDAKRSLTNLLKVMTEYAKDKFTLVVEADIY